MAAIKMASMKELPLYTDSKLGYKVYTHPNTGWERDGDLHVGYHVESSDTLKLAGNIPLSLGTLSDSRVLYICQNHTEWDSKWTTAIYKVYFKYPKYEVIFTSWDQYNKINPLCPNSKPLVLKLVHRKYGLFSIYENDRNELTESYLVNPTRYVKRIERIK